MQQISQNNHAKVYKRNKIFDFYKSIIPGGTNKFHNNNAIKPNKNNKKCC